MAISATTQQSRFHSETLQNVSEDVDLRQLVLTVGEEELLVDADLRLFAGVHYGLVGANGVGKSTLLKAIGEGLVVGFPSNIHALYVDQLRAISGAGTVLEQIMDADKDVLKWRRQAQGLQECLANSSEQLLAEAVRAVKLEDLREEVVEASMINELRSGERGKHAREHLLALEAKLAKAEGSTGKPPTAREVQLAPEVCRQMIEALHENLKFADADSAEARARKILSGIGFSRALQDKPISELSGGWRVRAALAQALFLEPDILLLDEPTNFLDLPSILWFQGYLKSLEDKTVVVISHDRAFLDDVAQQIIVFRNKKLAYHDGNYSEYVQATDEKRQHMQRLQEGIDKKKTRMEKSIQENHAAAKKAGDDKKLKQVASKQRKLEERAGMEKNDKGHRFRINKDMGGYFLSTRRDVVLDAADSVPAWKFPDPAALRTRGPLVQLDAVSFAYSAPAGANKLKAGPSRQILQDITLCLEQDARVALVGANGKGKSTLVKLVLGELLPASGSISRHPQAKAGVFAQDIVQQLLGNHGESTALDHLQSLFPDAKEQDLRKHLGSFGLKGSLATQKLRTLSGGQGVRTQLAALAYSSPHLLVLDEPSSHLDMLSIEALKACLAAYRGAVLLVSHDQHLVSSVAEKVFLVDNKAVRSLENGVSDYVRELRKKQRNSA